MPLIAVTSFKGGAGKTTLAANLAVGLTSLGWRVLAVDFDPQDALKMHFGLDPCDSRGFASQMLSGGAWEDSVYGADARVDVMPFGRVSAGLTGSITGMMAADSGRVFANLADLARERMVIVDAPSLPAAGTKRLCDIANLVIVATPTNAGSYAALALADPDTFLAADGILPKTIIVANSYEETNELQRGIHALLTRMFGAKLAATIEYDDAVDEALATRRTVLLHDHASPAARSLVGLALAVDRLCAPTGSR
jgi:cellulose synthase operon protein YhjQ